MLAAVDETGKGPDQHSAGRVGERLSNAERGIIEGERLGRCVEESR